MSFNIKLATTTEEKEAIYRFRYIVYVEELGKHHIDADHVTKMMFDNADDNALLYFAINEVGVIGTVRLMPGKNGFTSKLSDYFEIDKFEKAFPLAEMAIIDRLIVARKYRNIQLGHALSLATFSEGQKLGTRIVFMTSEEKTMPMHIHYGWRCYMAPKIIHASIKRFNFIFFTRDYAYLNKIGSPFVHHIDKDLLNARDEYVGKVESLLNRSVYIPKLSFKQYILNRAIDVFSSLNDLLNKKAA